MRSVSFFKGLSWLFLLNLVVKPIWIFFIDRQVQNTVGNEVYGSYFAALNLSYVLLFIADAGLSNTMNQKAATGQPVHTTRYLKLKIFLSLLYIVVICFVGWITNLDQWQLLFYVAGIQMLTSFFLFLRSLVTANQFFTTDAFFSVIDKTLMILLCGGFIYYPLTFGSINLLLFLKVQLLCTSLAVLAALFFVIKKQLFQSGIKEDIFSILKAITPFALIILLMSMHYRLDGFLLERMHEYGAYEAGVYASAYRLLDASNMAGYMAASFLVPFIARHQLDKSVLEEVIVNTRHSLLFFGIGVACFTVLFAPWVQQLLYHTNDSYNSGVIQLCIAVLPAYLVMHIYGSVLTATARFRSLLFILAISVLLNVLLNVLLIPSYGAVGCCIAALASHYVCAFACYIIATRSLLLSFMARSNMVYLATAAGLSLIFYMTRIAMINVWLILVLAICIVLVLLATQLTYVKKYFFRIR
jgi:O-antigen/teichoic acid export membrane protein